MDDETLPPASMLFCQECGRACTRVEASQRLFNNGKCAECGGELEMNRPRINQLHTRDDY